MCSNFDENQGYDDEINNQYMPSKWSVRENSLNLYLTRINEYSEEFRNSHDESITTVKYGEGPKQFMDIVKPANVQDDTPIMLFVHGGYWVVTSREMYLYSVGQALARGWIGVNIGYDQAPEVSMTTITNEIRDAYVYLSNQFPECRGITAVGHSAGGHLVAMLLATDWKIYSPGQRLVPITKCVPMSGIPDIRPIVHVSYNEQIQLSNAECTELSPLLQIEKAVSTIKEFGTKIISVVGEHDPPAFRRNCKKYTEALKSKSIPAQYIEIPVLDHFEMVEKLVEPDYRLHEIIFD